MLKFVALLCALTLPAGPALGEALQEFRSGPAALGEFTGKGKWVVLKIWVSDCEICNQEAHQYVDFHEFHRDTDAVMLGLSLDGDDRAAALDFIERHEIPYPNLLTDYATGAGWYTSVTDRPWIGTPTFLVYDPSGTLRAQQVGAVPTSLIEQFIADNSTAN
ncbi:MAG: TlpA family protein disulfide reductase [Gammaproteobacteria bacterium]|nr:TlpA family protein disulfide reductase [Gammaproteobacteria bacterium]